MTDVTLKDVGTGYNLKTTINENNDTLEAALAKTVSKDASDANEMGTALAMGGNSITGLPTAISDSEPVTLGQAASLASVTNPFTQTTIGTTFYPRTAAETGAVNPTGGTTAIADYTDGTSAKGTIVAPQYPPGDVRRYGYIVTTAADQSLAVQAAFNQNASTDASAAPVYTPPGEVLITTTVHWCGQGENDRTWNCNQTRFRLNTDINGVKIGPYTAPPNQTTTVSDRLNMTGELRVKNLWIPTSGATEDNNQATNKYAGITLYQVKSSTLRLSSIGSYYGILITASGQGFGYNDVHFGDINKNIYGVALIPAGDDSEVDEDYDGWINENIFHGGKFAAGDSDDRLDDGDLPEREWFIYIPYTSAAGHPRPNNNKFIGPSFDLAGDVKMKGCYFDDATYNFLLWPRTEVRDIDGGEHKEWPLMWGRHSLKGTLFGGYESTLGKNLEGDPNNNQIMDLGIQNNIYGNDGIHLHNGRGGNGSTVIQATRDRPNGDNVPIIEAMDLYRNSGNNQAINAVMQADFPGEGRYLAEDSYTYRSQHTGDIVHTGSFANNDVMYWECIQTHDSGDSVPEPGLGEGTGTWEDYWQPLHNNYMSGDTNDTELAAGTINAWNANPATGTIDGNSEYRGRATQYTVDGEGTVFFGDAGNQTTSGANGTNSIRGSAGTETPNDSSGVQATQGSLFLSKNGTAYVKAGSGATSWEELVPKSSLYWTYDTSRQNQDFTLVAADEKRFINVGVFSDDRVITVPKNSAVEFPIGTVIKILQKYDSVTGNTLTISPVDGDVTLIGDVAVTGVEGQTFLLTKVYSDHWYVESYITAASA